MTNFSPTPNMIAEKAGAVGRLVFNKPQKHNATSTDMWEAIPVILDEFEKDPAIRVIVVTGAGDKAFVSGADISEFEKARNTPEQVAYYDKIGEVANARLIRCSKPTIARIRGYCIGGGLAVSLTCDMRIASDTSKFGVPAARLGLGYRASGLKILMDLVGPSVAKEIFFTARHFSAPEALGMGLVNRVVADTELDSYVDNYCRMIGENAPLTMYAAKRTIEELTRLDGTPDFARLSGLVKQCFDSEDYIEGRRAFMEKRKPVFKGR
jgi:enoyl-CoA hydratase/carnithine racemase